MSRSFILPPGVEYAIEVFCVPQAQLPDPVINRLVSRIYIIISWCALHWRVPHNK